MEIKHCSNPKVRELAIMKCVHKKGGDAIIRAKS